MLNSVPRDYSLIAPVYNHVFNKVLSEGHRTLGSLIRKKKNPALKVLEVGVGSGLTINYLPNGIDYEGIDINAKMLTQAQSLIKIYPKKKIKLNVMDAHKLTYKANSFDVVMAASVLSAVSDPEEVMKEMIRVTKKGGEIAVVTNLRRNTIGSRIVRRFDPVMKKFIGFRTDMDQNVFQNFKGVELIEQKQVNNLMGFPLSTYLLFRKK